MEQVEHKLNWRFHFWWVLLSGVILLGGRVIYMLFTGQVSDEDGPLPTVISALFGGLLTVVMLSYAAAVITSWHHLLTCKGQAFTISPEGIENTVLVINVLAFVLVLRVRFIPWSSVKYKDFDRGVYLRVRIREVRCGLLAKLVLAVLGYSFCQGMIKPSLSEAEIEQIKAYCFLFGEDISAESLTE